MSKKDLIVPIFLLIIGFFLSISIGLGGVFAGLYLSNQTGQYAILIVSSFVSAVLGFVVFVVLSYKLLHLASVLKLLLWYFVFSVVFTICKLMGIFSDISWAVLPLYVYALQIILMVHASIQIRNEIRQIPPENLQKQEMQGYILLGFLMPALFWVLEKQGRLEMVSDFTMKLGNSVLLILFLSILGLGLYVYVKAEKEQTRGVALFGRILLACFLCSVIWYFSMNYFGYAIGIVCLCVVLFGMTIISVRNSKKFIVPINQAYQEGAKTGDWTFYFQELERLQQEEDAEKVYSVVGMQDGKKYKISIQHYMMLLKIDKLIQLGEWQKADIEIERAEAQIQDTIAQQVLQNEIAYFQKQKCAIEKTKKSK